MTHRNSTPPEPASAPHGAARDELIMRHARLVRSIARRYTGRGRAYDDIIQSGYIGLIQAEQFISSTADRTKTVLKDKLQRSGILSLNRMSVT